MPGLPCLLLLAIQSYFALAENSLFKLCQPVLLPMDVLFLLDGSGSVSGNTFDMQMNMLRKVTELMHLEEQKSRLAVMQYAGYTRLEIPFSHNKTKEEISIALQEIHYMSGSTKTGKALRKARDILREEKRKLGSRHVKQVIIVVSDGHSHDLPMEQAVKLRADGISLVVLGIGPHINHEELLQITGSEEYAFQNLHKEEELKNFVKSFANISQEIECHLIRKPRGATVTCNDDGFTVTVSTAEPLKGALYVSGHLTDPNCFSRSSKKIEESNMVHYDTTLTVKYNECGVKETITENSQMFTATVILQFHAILATDQDKIYPVSCYRDENNPVFKVLNENSALPPPSCSYSVKPFGSCSSVLLNDILVHAWKCDYEDVSMTVHSCEMVEPVTRQSYKFMDTQGCSISPYFFPVSQTAGLQSTGQSSALRFGTSPLVLFRCTLRLCKGQDCQKMGYLGFKHRTTSSCRKRREILKENPLTTGDTEYEYSEEFPSVESRKEEATRPPVLSITLGRAVVKPLTIPATVFPGYDVLVNTKRLAIVEGQKEATEIHDGRAETRAQTSSGNSESPELIVFGKGGELERVSLKPLPVPSTTVADVFPTLISEDTTTLPTATANVPTSEPSWEVDIVVESDPILVRLKRETFTTTCKKN